MFKQRLINEEKQYKESQRSPEGNRKAQRMMKRAKKFLHSTTAPSIKDGGGRPPLGFHTYAICFWSGGRGVWTKIVCALDKWPMPLLGLTTG